MISLMNKMEKLFVKNEITINASLDKVWNVLVNPEETAKYMFGCKAISDWETGCALDWKMNYEGQEMTPVKGFILDIIPNSLLKYSVIDPNANYPDIPENYLNVTYELSEANGQTKFTVTQDGFENAAEGEKRYKDVYNNGEGWQPILIQIKNIAEEK